MSFKYKKVKYENIYEWDEENKGTCFYCKQDKDPAIKLIGEKGICKECLDNFEIGNVGADRHVIHQIRPKFENYKEVVQWLLDKGVKKMVLKDILDIDGKDVYIYDAVNNVAAYEDYYKQRKEKGIIPLTEEFMYSSNSVEIAEDGSNIHIIY